MAPINASALARLSAEIERAAVALTAVRELLAAMEAGAAGPTSKYRNNSKWA